VNVGGFGARLKALLEREVEAASLLPPQIDMAEELGLRKIIANTFRTIWWAPAAMPAGAVQGYLRALDRAEAALQRDLKKYLPLWKYSVPPEFEAANGTSTGSPAGERFVYRPFPREEFDEIFRQVERWGLDQYARERAYENLVYSAGS
jgi:hypothetical protein